jgi:hypothetical protein
MLFFRPLDLEIPFVGEKALFILHPTDCAQSRRAFTHHLEDVAKCVAR